ncbi:MAG: hypothetical protein VZR54_05095 [Ruminococcus sp.]|nr:hypothetical protein [Ruminococcus sp.]
MFREMLRKKQKISDDDCIVLLKKEKRGVLSVIGDDEYLTSVNDYTWNH